MLSNDKIMQYQQYSVENLRMQQAYKLPELMTKEKKIIILEDNLDRQLFGDIQSSLVQSGWFC